MKAALRRQEKAKKEKKAFEMNVVMHDIFEYLLLPQTRVLACVLTLACFNSACSTFKLAATLGEEAFTKHDAQGGHTTTNGGAHYARATAAEPKPSADHHPPTTTEPSGLAHPHRADSAQPNACK